MAFDFPSSPTTGQQYLTPNGLLYLYNGSSWNTLGIELFPNPFSNYFLYRTIYTHGYMSGGYKNSSPWKNSNRTVHATDITTNLGDLMDRGGAYVMGSYSDFNQYIYAASDSFPGTGVYTTSVSMINEAGRTHSSSWDLINTAGNYGDCGVILNPGLTLAYILNDNTNVEKHNLITEIMYSAGSGGTAVGTAGDWVCTWQGETYGWVKHSSQGSRNHKMYFATEVWSSAGLTVGTDGWGKALSTKHGYTYVKNGGNCVNSIYKVNDTTGANISTSLNSPGNRSGEENYETGQNVGYCIGFYTDLVGQVNTTYKVNFLTDSMTTMGSDTEPKGHDGASSAACASAAALLVGVR